MESTPAPAARLTILLVEDDPLIGLLLGEMLASLGHTVCPLAETEAAALIAVSVHHPDLMIVDAKLGDGSGVAVMTEILQTRFVPHIFMSGNPGLLRQQRPDAIFLQKPFDERALLRAMHNALTERGVTQ